MPRSTEQQSHIKDLGVFVGALSIAASIAVACGFADNEPPDVEWSVKHVNAGITRVSLLVIVAAVERTWHRDSGVKYVRVDDQVCLPETSQTQRHECSLWVSVSSCSGMLAIEARAEDVEGNFRSSKLSRSIPKPQCCDPVEAIAIGSACESFKSANDTVRSLVDEWVALKDAAPLSVHPTNSEHQN